MNCRRSQRRTFGVTILEMVMGLIVLIPVVLLLIDLTIIALAIQVNDNAAREADRLAASGDPSQALARAQQVLKRVNQNSSGYASNITLAKLTFSPTDLVKQAAAFVPYGGVISGSVTVQTQVTVNPLIIAYVAKGPYIFQSSQTCPITYIVPNTAGAVTP